MEARRQRIEDMVRNLLPCIEECRRKERIATLIIHASILCYMLLGAFLINDYLRPINSNEYTIITTVITASAQETHTQPETITRDLLSQFNIQRVQDLKSHQWNDALQFLSNAKPLRTGAL